MKILKWLLILMVGVIAVLSITVIALNESLPEGGTAGDKADKLAEKMEKALGKEHWHDIQYVQWSFMGVHHFLWDKHRNMARVKWDDRTVYIKPNTNEGMAFIDGSRVASDKEAKFIKTANDYFNNDMFWLVAPFKTFDEGVERRVINYEGEDRLLVTYNSGGSTPGDSYLWKLASDGTPLSYKMWTDIIPIGGVETSWDQYFTFGNGVKISHFHEGLGPLNIVVSDVSTGYNKEDVNCEKDPFKILITGQE